MTDYAVNFYSDWFTVSKRRERASFAAALFIGGAFVMSMIADSKYLFGFQSGIFEIVFYLMWWAALGCLACQRLLDIGASRWWGLPFVMIQFLYVLIPYGSLISLSSVAVLVFWPSSESELVNG